MLYSCTSFQSAEVLASWWNGWFFISLVGRMVRQELVANQKKTEYEYGTYMTNTNTPRLQLSTALSYPSVPRISGATNPGVPHLV